MMTRWAATVLVLGSLCSSCDPPARPQAAASAAAPRDAGQPPAARAGRAPEAAASAATAPGSPACPPGARHDEPRRQRLLALLLGAGEEARSLAVRGRDKVRFCFVERDHSAITTDGRLLLDPRQPDHELAARVGHLLHHAVQGSPYRDDGSRDCRARVDEALRREAQALALELRLRRALGVERPLLAAEIHRQFRSAPEAERPGIIFAYLQAHPHGGPGIDALGAGYLARCQRERSK